MKIVVFDLWGDYGHFRIPYTTSSPLSFPIPTKTAIYGIIGAFLGYNKNTYLENFQNGEWKISISIKNRVKKIYIPENFINTKKAKMFSRMPKNESCRTQINMEFIKNPYFRIYVNSQNNGELLKLENLLKEHRSHYTIVLGISECLANFKYLGTFDGIEKSNPEFTHINSILPLKEITSASSISFIASEEREFIKIHIPTEMRSDRELSKTADFLIERTGKTIYAKVKKYTEIKELSEKIILF